MTMTYDSVPSLTEQKYYRNIELSLVSNQNSKAQIFNHGLHEPNTNVSMDGNVGPVGNITGNSKWLIGLFVDSSEVSWLGSCMDGLFVGWIVGWLVDL